MIRRVVAKVGPYGLNTLLVFAIGVLSVPAIIAFAGMSQWTGLAIAQSVAALAAVIVGFGWPATGPTHIAASIDHERRREYLRSLIVRGSLFVVVAPITALVAVALTGLSPIAAVLGASAYLLQALGGSWYFIGESRPYRVLLIDTLPRTSSIIVGIVVLSFTGSMELYTAILLLGTMTAAVVGAGVILRGPKLERPTRGEILAAASAQRHGLIATSFGSLYSNSPLVIASIVIPGTIDTFALAFKLYQYAAAAFQPLVQVAQGWIPAAGARAVQSRVITVRRVAYGLAAAAALAMTALLPLAASIMSGGANAGDYSLALPFGLATAAILLNQIIGLACLTAVGRAEVLALSAACGAVVGIFLLIGLANAWGETGLAWAIGVTEWLVTIIQLTSLRRALRRLHPEADQ